MRFNIRDFGAAGDGASNDTEAVQGAVDAAAQNGGTVEFPTGCYCTGTVFLMSNITVDIGPGATWKGIEDLSAYPMIKPFGIDNDSFGPWRSFIYAAGQDNITLCGGGRIFPNGSAECFQKNRKGNSPERPFGLRFIACENVTVRDLSMEHSAFWMQHYFGCDGVRLRGLNVFNRGNLNNDGVDIDSCSDVTVSDCIIDSSDDALCFKSGTDRPVENAAVTNCILSSEASAFKLGTASRGGFRNMTVSNCVIKPCRADEVEHALQARAGLMGIDLGNVDGGVLEDILVSNIVIEGTETPIFMKLGCRSAGKAGEHRAIPERSKREGVYQRVHIDNVTARDCGPLASIIIAGYPGNNIRDIRLSRVYIQAEHPSVEEPDFDVELQAETYPMNRIFGQNLPAYGIYARYVDGLALSDIRLRPANGDARTCPYVFQDVTNLRTENIDPVPEN